MHKAYSLRTASNKIPGGVEKSAILDSCAISEGGRFSRTGVLFVNSGESSREADGVARPEPLATEKLLFVGTTKCVHHHITLQKFHLGLSMSDLHNALNYSNSQNLGDEKGLMKRQCNAEKKHDKTNNTSLQNFAHIHVCNCTSLKGTGTYLSGDRPLGHHLNLDAAEPLARTLLVGSTFR